MNITLTDVEARIIGCLIEKSVTTPEYYPLTLNSLTSACNQKSNRDPVMSLDEKTISDALDSLRYNHHLVWQVTEAGSRVPKYKHDAIDVFGLTDEELAVVCVLLLRGPQTPGELRSRTGRLFAFGSPAEVVTALDGLRNRESVPLVARLPREPGSREQRYAHLLCGPVAAAAEREPTATPVASDPPAGEDRIASLERELESVRRELEDLKARFAELTAPAGG